MKRARNFGVVRGPDGDTIIRSRRVAEMLEGAKRQAQGLNADLAHARANVDRLKVDLKAETLSRIHFRDALMRLQNHWWTRLGEALRIVRPT